ncbi:unnamed protein product [Periconia digitata]|uniref:Uncharacterized protein n=1 Tax=Periconia digitata TaxID=1303443 RepID=A0A9W4UT55_9PLEO|nr:unnamed protein product [Periconia digitata]
MSYIFNEVSFYHHVLPETTTSSACPIPHRQIEATIVRDSMICKKRWARPDSRYDDGRIQEAKDLNMDEARSYRGEPITVASVDGRQISLISIASSFSMAMHPNGSHVDLTLFLTTSSSHCDRLNIGTCRPSASIILRLSVMMKKRNSTTLEMLMDPWRGMCPSNSHDSPSSLVPSVFWQHLTQIVIRPL